MSPQEDFGGGYCNTPLPVTGTASRQKPVRIGKLEQLNTRVTANNTVSWHNRQERGQYKRTGSKQNHYTCTLHL